MAISIRTAERGEMGRILERIIETSWSDLPPAAQARTTRRQVERQVAALVDQLRHHGTHTFLVAQSDTEANIGHLWLGETTDAMSGEPRAYIFDVYVEPLWRGHGVGMLLLTRAEEVARGQGYAEIGLMVAAHNTVAQALYARAGFSTERLLMSKPLDPSP